MDKNYEYKSKSTKFTQKINIKIKLSSSMMLLGICGYQLFPSEGASVAKCWRYESPRYDLPCWLFLSEVVGFRSEKEHIRLEMKKYFLLTSSSTLIQNKDCCVNRIIVKKYLVTLHSFKFFQKICKTQH